jgi:hypothetical protein
VTGSAWRRWVQVADPICVAQIFHSALEQRCCGFLGGPAKASTRPGRRAAPARRQIVVHGRYTKNG